MTDKQKAIAALIEAVEAGGSDAVNRILKKIACDARNVGEHAGWVHDASKAYVLNSLDAAKALQDAILPDGSGNGGSNWTVDISIDGDTDFNEYAGTKVNVYDGSYHASCWTDIEATSLIPARAWLLAILKAYAAQIGGNP